MGIVKSECAHARTYATREETALDPLECIEVVCNIQFNYRVGVKADTISYQYVTYNTPRE